MPENNRTTQPEGKQLRKENKAVSCREVKQKSPSLHKKNPELHYQMCEDPPQGWDKFSNYRGSEVDSNFHQKKVYLKIMLDEYRRVNNPQNHIFMAVKNAMQI